MYKAWKLLSRCNQCVINFIPAEKDTRDIFLPLNDIDTSVINFKKG